MESEDEVVEVKDKEYTLVLCRRELPATEAVVEGQQPATSQTQLLLGLKKRGFGVGKWLAVFFFFFPSWILLLIWAKSIFDSLFAQSPFF